MSGEGAVTVTGLREGKWAALAALLLLAQPGYTQDRRAKDDPFVSLREHLERTTQQGPDGSPAAPRPRAPRPQPEPRPAIWLLQDADTKIYLFGTVHILPPGYRWRSAAVNDAIRQADELVLEVGDREAMADPATFLDPMMLGKQAPLTWRVSPERREPLRRMLEELGIPAMDTMQSWAAALMIMAMSAMQGIAGDEEAVDPGEMPGVEEGLETEFRALNRPISGVESVAEQIGFFRNLSFTQQRELLEAMIDDYARASAEESDPDFLDAWIRGRPEGIVIRNEDMPGVLYEVLLPRRNRAWTDWLIARLDRPGTILFAVGAGHLAGPDSVQTMLAARGFTATRVD
ncbi:MAG TPA: TraB/GumN family protein [Allosphingosinicella sp.]|nr:TraB/GumN family protein [Allosphingosinicella sp.]